MKTITTNEILDLVKSIPNGRMFSMVYERVAPKCVNCGVSHKEWAGMTYCPKCDSELELTRYIRVQLGVKNPKHCLKPGTGSRLGESGETALADGRLKYFDMDVVNESGRGNYRQCKIENIREIHLNGEIFIVQ